MGSIFVSVCILIVLICYGLYILSFNKKSYVEVKANQYRYCNDIVTWPGHLIRHTNLSEQFNKVMNLAHLKRHHPQASNSIDATTFKPRPKRPTKKHYTSTFKDIAAYAKSSI